MRALLRICLPLFLLGLAIVGCGVTGKIQPNRAPETTIFVSGTLDTVNHVAHLHWFGSDADGQVVAYEIRLLNPATPEDTAWVQTLRADSIVTVAAPSGFTAPVFQVRSVDNEGMRDPTPAQQDFRFSNQPPTVQLTDRPAFTDTTFASVTVSWTAGDIDGDLSKTKYFVWLDGLQATPESTMTKTFTMPSARFFNNTGTYNNGYRMLFVQARDDGGRYGNVDSVRWYVRRPVTGTRARVLILDDVPTTNVSNVRFDTLYANGVGRLVPSDQVAVMRLQNRTPFRSAMDVQQTFQLFESVIWYRANETSFPTMMHDYQAGIEGYLDHGGKIFLEGLYLLEGKNATGALTEAFTQTYLNCRGFLNCFVITTSLSDSTAGFSNPNGSRFISPALADSSRQQQLATRLGEPGGLRALLVRDNSKVLMWALPGALSPTQPDTLPVAVMNDRPGGGRVLLTTVPFSTSLATGGTAPRLVQKVLGLLGLQNP